MARVHDSAGGFVSTVRRALRRLTNGRTATSLPGPEHETVWDRIAAIGNRIPEEDLARWPKDSARNFDHYLDGAPRQD